MPVTVRWMSEETLSVGGIDDLARAHSSGNAWIDIQRPDEAVVGRVAEEFGVHPLAVEDFLHFPQRPKIDTYEDGFFIVWELPRRSDDDAMISAELDIFLGRGYLITSHREAVPSLEHVAGDARSIVPRGPEWTLHAILDCSVDDLFPICDYIGDRLDSIEDQLLESPGKQQLRNLYAMKRLLVALHKIIGPERDVVRGMARQTELISQEAYLYFQDIGDHLARVMDSVETYRDVASGAMDIYLSSVNNRMNEIMKQLTVVATIFMPLTLLSGIYGMNVIRGMWPPVGAPWSFAVVIGSMVAITMGMLWAFRKRDWW